MVNGSTQTVVAGGPYSGAGEITYDGAHMWVGGSNSNMYEIYPTGSTYASVNFTGNGGAMAYDGKYIWVTGNPVTKLLPQTNSNGIPTTPKVVGTFPTGPQPNGIAFDGANIWVASSNSNTLFKF
jgi:hypothetical protein